jgi:hypothetical protein
MEGFGNEALAAWPGTTMNQRFLMWGLTSIAFVVTLAISSWHEGLWTSDAIHTRGNRPAPLASAEPTELPIRPFAPENAAPTAMTPAPLAATKPGTQAQEQQPTSAAAEIATASMPIAEAEVDTSEFLAHRDRASQHGSRAR